MKVYIASSFRHLHAVRLLGQAMKSMGYVLLDWTEKACPPEGLSSSKRREWMDADHGGEVFSFCAKSCIDADLVIYFGESGQDAGIEVGVAYGKGIPILGIRGPLESPGLMLHGACTVWVKSIDKALLLLEELILADGKNMKDISDKAKLLLEKINYS